MKHRLALTAATTALLVGVTACGNSTTPSGGDEPEGCGDCAIQTEALGAKVKKVDGVRRIDRIEYITARGISRLPSVRLVVRLDPGSLRQVVDAVTELAWKSDIAPLNVVNVTSLEGNADPEETSIFFDGNEADAYEAEWGPRPTE